MSSKFSQYELSEQADQDLEDIFDYSVQEFGLERSVTYVMDFEELFYAPAENPGLRAAAR